MQNLEGEREAKICHYVQSRTQALLSATKERLSKWECIAAKARRGEESEEDRQRESEKGRQCEQMARLFDQYLAIHNSENVRSSINFSTK